MFVYEGKLLRQIAAELGINVRTLEKWSSQGNWGKLRKERRRGTSQAALDVLKRQRELLITALGVENRADPEQIDALHKLTMSIEKMESRLEDIGLMLDVMDRFAEFVAARADDADCRVIRNWVEKFFDEQQRKSR
jgi:transposase